MTEERLDAEAVLPARIDGISVASGGGSIWSTQKHVILRELPWKVGEVVTLDQWNRGIRRLWNLGGFSGVHGWFERRGNRLEAFIKVDDRWSILPLFEYQSGGSAIWMDIGITEDNFLGLQSSWDVFYQYFDGTHGGQIFYRDSRLFDKRIEFRGLIGRLMRPRPDFTVQRAAARGGLNFYLRDDTVRLGFTLGVFHDVFLQPVEGPPNPMLPSPMQTLQLEPTLRFGRIDIGRVQHNGAAVELRPHVSATQLDGLHPFGGLLAELIGFHPFGRFTFSNRTRAVVQTRTVERQLDHWVGGLDTIRGYRDNFVRANTYLLTNVELSAIVFDTKLIVVELAAFADAALTNTPGSGRTAMLSAGPGLRFVLPTLADSSLRIDFPYALVAASGFDLSLATRHFISPKGIEDP